jgi:hypothetical protein
LLPVESNGDQHIIGLGRQNHKVFYNVDALDIALKRNLFANFVRGYVFLRWVLGRYFGRFPFVNQLFSKILKLIYTLVGKPYWLLLLLHLDFWHMHRYRRRYRHFGCLFLLLGDDVSLLL